MLTTLLTAVLSICGPLDNQFHLSQTPTEIPIIPGRDNGDVPRDSTQAPILCFLISNTIMLDFYTDLGIIDVTISEESDGIVYEESVNSGSGVSILDFSGIPGNYTITFSLQSGQYFFGEFSL